MAGLDWKDHPDYQEVEQEGLLDRRDHRVQGVSLGGQGPQEMMGLTVLLEHLVQLVLKVVLASQECRDQRGRRGEREKREQVAKQGSRGNLGLVETEVVLEHLDYLDQRETEGSPFRVPEAGTGFQEPPD